MDGVITDTIEGHYQSWKRLAAEEGLPFSREINEKLRGLSRPDSLAIVLNGSPRSEAEIKTLLAKKNEYFLEIIAHFSAADILPGVTPLLQDLKKRGIAAAVASSSRNTRIILDKLGLSKEFETIIDSTRISKAKPAPDLFLAAAAQLQIPPAECLVIEDAEAGISAAHTAGMLAVGIGPADRVGAADFRYNSMTEVNLERILNREDPVEE